MTTKGYAKSVSSQRQWGSPASSPFICDKLISSTVAFSASTEAVEEARRLIAAFDEAKADGRMAFSFGSPQKREPVQLPFFISCSL